MKDCVWQLKGVLDSDFSACILFWISIFQMLIFSATFVCLLLQALYQLKSFEFIQAKVKPTQAYKIGLIIKLGQAMPIKASIWAKWPHISPKKPTQFQDFK